LTMGGRPEEAIEPAEKAMRLDPMNTDRYWWLAGIAYLGMGRWEDAAAVAESFVEGFLKAGVPGRASDTSTRPGSTS
jgi:tetratricopeptide (TPR) repeat protein